MLAQRPSLYPTPHPAAMREHSAHDEVVVAHGAVGIKGIIVHGNTRVAAAAASICLKTTRKTAV